MTSVRPEIGSYVANRNSAYGMFDLRLHDRLGERPLHTVDNSKADDWWGRIVSTQGYNKFSDNALSSSNKMQLIQVGKTLNQSKHGKDGKYQWGVMATYETAIDHPNISSTISNSPYCPSSC